MSTLAALAIAASLMQADQSRTYLASVEVGLGSQDSISEFTIDTWGVQYEAVCHIPSGWRVEAGSSAILEGRFRGEGSHGATWLNSNGLRSLHDLVLITMYGPVQRQDVRDSSGKVIIPATFKGQAIVGDGERRLKLSHENVRLMPATACPELSENIASSGDAKHQTEMLDWNGSRAQADDAMRRWAPKAGESLEQVRRGWSPQLMAFPTKNCIQLWPQGVGGTPIYCYRADTVDLVEEYSDAE